MDHPSKEIIFLLTRFLYVVINARNGEKDHALFTDNDSLMYDIDRMDVSNDMVEVNHHFDISNLERINPYYELGFATNKAVVGKNHDEVAGNPIAEFVGLPPKSIPSRR